MKVGQLKKLLASVQDDLDIVISSDDHSYRQVYVKVTKLDKDNRTYYDPESDAGEYDVVVVE